MTNVSDKHCRENQNTHFMFFLNHAFMRMWKNIVEPDRPQMAIWRMRIAWWITKASDTHTHSEYVILTVFPLQQHLHESDPVFQHTHIACLVFSCFRKTAENNYELRHVCLSVRMK
jgi:hypothetical protein